MYLPIITTELVTNLFTPNLFQFWRSRMLYVPTNQFLFPCSFILGIPGTKIQFPKPSVMIQWLNPRLAQLHCFYPISFFCSRTSPGIDISFSHQVPFALHVYDSIWDFLFLVTSIFFFKSCNQILWRTLSRISEIFFGMVQSKKVLPHSQATRIANGWERSQEDQIDFP